MSMGFFFTKLEYFQAVCKNSFPEIHQFTGGGGGGGNISQLIYLNPPPPPKKKKKKKKKIFE